MNICSCIVNAFVSNENTSNVHMRSHGSNICSNRLCTGDGNKPAHFNGSQCANMRARLAQSAYKMSEVMLILDHLMHFIPEMYRGFSDHEVLYHSDNDIVTYSIDILILS